VSTRVWCYEIGSCDLCDAEATAQLVAGGIYNLMKTLRETYRVNSVVVFEVLERDEPARDCRWMKCTLEAYNEKVRSLNEMLKTWCAGVPGVTFRKHRKDAKRLGDDRIQKKLPKSVVVLTSTVSNTMLCSYIS